MSRSVIGGVAALAAFMAMVAGARAAEAAPPLVEAAKRGDRPAALTLIHGGVDVSEPAPDGTTALHWAAHHDDLALARALVAAGADPDARNRYGVAPLTLSCLNGSATMTGLLLDAGAEAHAIGADGETALMVAARTGVDAVVELLLRHGADVNAAETWRGQTALMWAAAEGHVDVVDTLLSHGAEVRVASGRGFTPLLFAARQGHIAVAGRLLAAGASLDEALTVNSRRTAGGVEVRPTSEEGLNAFLLAVGNAHYELAATLLAHGADPNAAPRGWTALHQMSWVRKTGVAGSNNPAPPGSGMIASLDFVKLLVSYGADLDARVTLRPPAGITSLNMVGGTPFLLAARTADAPLMRLLAELGADPLLANEDGTTPLMVAAGVGTSSPGEDPGTEPEVLEAVQVALDLGGKLDAVDDNGETAMHGAAYKHVPSVVRYLAERGASVEVWNRPNAKGWTPLKITEGVHRGMNIISSSATEEAVREVMGRAAAAR